MIKQYQITLEELLADLEAGDTTIKEKALRHLSHFDDGIDTGPVIKCLKSSNNYIRELAIKVLGKQKCRVALKSLASLLSDEDNIIREKSCIALGKIADKAAVDALISTADDTNDYVREAVVWALGQIADERSLPCLLNRLYDKDSYVSRKAMEAIVKIGEQNIEAVIKSLHENSVLNKNDVYNILNELIKDPEELESLIKQLKNNGKYVPGAIKPRIRLKDILYYHRNVMEDLDRKDLIYYCVKNKEAVVTSAGRLATWNHSESTGRSPKDTLCVKRKETQKYIDWNSPNNNPISEKHFDMIFKDALSFIKSHEKIYISNRSIGADPDYALPIRTITNSSLTALFTMNMFRNIPGDIEKSAFANKEFLLLVLPNDKLDENKYKKILRKLPCGDTSRMVIAMDYDRKLGIVIGSAYLGSVKEAYVHCP